LRGFERARSLSGNEKKPGQQPKAKAARKTRKKKEKKQKSKNGGNGAVKGSDAKNKRNAALPEAPQAHGAADSEKACAATRAAAQAGRLSALRKALEARPELALARDDKNRSLLMEAAAGGRLACVEWLAGRSDLLARDKEGNTALNLAAAAGHVESVEALAASGDAQAKNDLGRDALMLAAMAGSVPCVEMLLPFSDPEAKDRSGKTAMELANEEGHASCAEALAGRASGATLERALAASPDPAMLPRAMELFERAQAEMAEKEGPGVEKDAKSLQSRARKPGGRHRR
jgi:hypothetical protein